MPNLLCENVRPDGNGFTRLRQLHVDGITIVEGDGGIISAVPQGPIAGLREDRFVPADGQTRFELSQLPGAVVLVFLNGFLQRLNQDYVIFGQDLTWISTEFDLGPLDDLEVVY